METSIKNQRGSCCKFVPSSVGMSCAIPIKAILDAPTAKGIIYAAFKDFPGCLSDAMWLWLNISQGHFTILSLLYLTFWLTNRYCPGINYHISGK